jgi:hypothetical protein
LMARYRAINLRFAENWEEEYKRSSPVNPVGENMETADSSGDESGLPVEEQEDARLRKLLPAAAKRVARKKSPRGTSNRS